MNNLHSVFQGVMMAGTLYGWRLDAMVMSGLLWAVLAAYDQVATAGAPHLAWIGA